MAKAECIDETGQLRSEEDLKEALKVVETSMMKDMMKIPPGLFVLLPTIREALLELLCIRKAICEHKKG